jgi:FHA domain
MAGVNAGLCFACEAPLIPGKDRCPECKKIQPKKRAARATPVSASPHALSPGSIDLVLPGDVRIELPVGNRIEIGREGDYPGMAVALKDFVDVSRQHVVITHGPTGVTVLDLQSTFGTWVDEQPLDSGQSLVFPNPQRIRLGSSCYVKVVPHAD